MDAKIQIYARLPQELVNDLDCNARLLGVSRSDLLQSAIARYLEQPDKIPYASRFSELERRIKDLELIVRSRPK